MLFYFWVFYFIFVLKLFFFVFFFLVFSLSPSFPCPPSSSPPSSLLPNPSTSPPPCSSCSSPYGHRKSRKPAKPRIRPCGSLQFPPLLCPHHPFATELCIFLMPLKRDWGFFRQWWNFWEHRVSINWMSLKNIFGVWWDNDVCWQHRVLKNWMLGLCWTWKKFLVIKREAWGRRKYREQKQFFMTFHTKLRDPLHSFGEHQWSRNTN